MKTFDVRVSRWNAGLFALLLVAPLSAQDVPAGVTIENAKVKVHVATEQPHHPSAQHEHPVNRVMIYLDAGEMSSTTPAGKVNKYNFKKGDVLWSAAPLVHVSENITDHPLQLVEIELKGKPEGAPKPLSKLDPLKVDPKHYKLEFENDQVRVIRVRFGPHEKAVEHEHTMDHVVVYLTDDATGAKRGQSKFDPPNKHSEENTLDRAVERLVVDLKY